MDAQVAELAKQIAGQEAYQHATFWIVLGALALIGVLLIAYLHRYAEKIADIKAQTDKLPEIKAQLVETTHATEEIKAEISQKRWRERERMTLYRTRLEELLTATYSVSEEASRMYSAASNDERIYQSASPENRLKTIAAFYFPELNVQVSNVVVLGTKVSATAIRVNNQWRLYKLNRTSAPTAEAKDEVSKEYIAMISASSTAMQGYYRDLLAAVKTVERSAVLLIPQYVS